MNKYVFQGSVHVIEIYGDCYFYPAYIFSKEEVLKLHELDAAEYYLEDGYWACWALDGYLDTEWIGPFPTEEEAVKLLE